LISLEVALFAIPRTLYGSNDCKVIAILN